MRISIQFKVLKSFFFFLSSLCQRFLSAAAACGKTLAISNFKCFEPPFGNLVIFSFQTFLLSFLNNVPLSQCDCKNLALINPQWIPSVSFIHWAQKWLEGTQTPFALKPTSAYIVPLLFRNCRGGGGGGGFLLCKSLFFFWWSANTNAPKEQILNDCRLCKGGK